MIADIETLYARLGERDYEAVMSYLADDIVWIVADNSPLVDHSPYHGIAEVRLGVFERLTADFDKLVFDAKEIFECKGGERVVALGYYYFRFHGQAEERKAQVAHVWTIRDGRAVKFQQYLDTLQVARDAGAGLRLHALVLPDRPNQAMQSEPRFTSSSYALALSACERHFALAGLILGLVRCMVSTRHRPLQFSCSSRSLLCG